MKGFYIWIYILLPYALWPLAFNIFKDYFWFFMPLNTTILGFFTLLFFRDYIKQDGVWKSFLAGLVFSFFLYIIFIVGDMVSNIMNFSIYVDYVYNILRTVPNQSLLIFGLAWIGLMEEIYWRGGLQGIFHEKYATHNWIFSTLLYSAVHITTLNPVLVGAAFVVGLVLSIIVEKFGIFTSITAHIIWLELILIIFPLR